jgi:hypothetical protein
VPFLTAYIYKIKIHPKHILASVVILIIVFSPFIFYKTHVFEKKFIKNKIESIGQNRKFLPSLTKIILTRGNFESTPPPINSLFEEAAIILNKVFLQNGFKRIALAPKTQFQNTFTLTSFLLNYSFILFTF